MGEQWLELEGRKVQMQSRESKLGEELLNLLLALPHIALGRS